MKKRLTVHPIRGKPGDPVDAVLQVKFLVGGVFRRVEDGTLLHYVESALEERAIHEWLIRGFSATSQDKE